MSGMTSWLNPFYLILEPDISRYIPEDRKPCYTSRVDGGPVAEIMAMLRVSGNTMRPTCQNLMARLQVQRSKCHNLIKQRSPNSDGFSG